ncbi:uncharacterized protein UHOD_12045 [Ustilago sp. UG-2017b]|nr:uncharacterized protein UHOD_12045 [Ustilago sp. UG-2017b]
MTVRMSSGLNKDAVLSRREKQKGSNASSEQGKGGWRIWTEWRWRKKRRGAEVGGLADDRVERREQGKELKTAQLQRTRQSSAPMDAARQNPPICLSQLKAQPLVRRREANPTLTLYRHFHTVTYRLRWKPWNDRHLRERVQSDSQMAIGSSDCTLKDQRLRSGQLQSAPAGRPCVALCPCLLQHQLCGMQPGY